MGWPKIPYSIRFGFVGFAITLVTAVVYLALMLMGHLLPTFFLFDVPGKIFPLLLGWGGVLSGFNVVLLMLVLSPLFWFVVFAMIGQVVAMVRDRFVKRMD
jgi:hypothetical protein